MRLIDKDSLMEIMNCNKPLTDGYHMKDEVEEMNKEKEPLLMLALLDRAIGYNDCIDEILGGKE